MSALVIVTPPGTEPISAAEAKLHCRVDSADDDALITALIVSARQCAETETRRALVTQTIDLVLDEFPAWCIHLPRPTIQSVTSITYIDTDGISQTLGASEYQVDAKGEPGRIVPSYGKVWPCARRQPNAVTVRYVAGYLNAAAVPQGIKQWMLLHVGHWYANRDAAGAKLEPMPFIGGLLDPFRVVSF